MTLLLETLKGFLKMAKWHTCFQVSMTRIQLYGIMDLDAAVSYARPAEGEEEVAKLTLHQVMLWHFHTRDGLSPLFVEIHQKQPGRVVEAVVPNTQEVDAMVDSMN